MVAIVSLVISIAKILCNWNINANTLSPTNADSHSVLQVFSVLSLIGLHNVIGEVNWYQPIPRQQVDYGDDQRPIAMTLFSSSQYDTKLSKNARSLCLQQKSERCRITLFCWMIF